jgi:hypothetical protein
MRGVSRRGGLLAIALIGLAGLAASVAFGAQATTSSETATLPSDSTTHTVTATCPRGTKATGGGIQLSDDYNDFAQGYYPAAGRGWTAAAWRSSAGDAEVTAVARCLAGARMTTKAVRGDILDDGASHEVTATCPTGTKLAGGGAKLSLPDNNELGGSYPSGPREWTAIGRAAGGGPGEIVASARCLKNAKVAARSEDLVIPDGNFSYPVTATCPKRTKATGGGAELSNNFGDYVQGSFPKGRRSWTAVGYSASQGTVTAHVLCLKKGGR